MLLMKRSCILHGQVFINRPVQSLKWLEPLTFGFKKKRDYIIHVAKTKALINFAITARLICVFVFGKAKSGFLMMRLIGINSFTSCSGLSV